MGDYIYSLSSDFGGNLAAGQLSREIMADVTIVTTLVTIRTKGDVVTVSFVSAISGAEETALDNLVAAHVPIVISKELLFSLSIPENIVESTTYVSLTSFLYTAGLVINNMCIISLMAPGGTSYDVRIYDSTNNNTIASANFNNTSETNQSLGTISNLPIVDSIFEIQAKVNGSTTAYIRNLNYT